MSLLDTILSTEKPYRRRQVEKAWFDVSINGYDEITSLPVELRSRLKDLPWLCLKQKVLLKSNLDNTRKLLFELADGNLIETVVMGRGSRKVSGERVLSPTLSTAVERGAIDSPPSQRRGQGEDSLADRYTICISSQAGCPMGCVFCATGKGGFKRNLTVEEIVDQIRFSQRLLAKENARISNIVIMGQGEPLLNYDNVKRALNIILANTDIGLTKITLSTCGVPEAMDRMLEDKEFPLVRIAVSLHSAIEATRKKILPSHRPGFLNFLVDWSKKYHKKFGTKTHFIGLEYIMLSGVNDSEPDLAALIKLAKKMPHVRINLIPFNKDDSAVASSSLSPRERGGGEGLFAGSRLSRASEPTITHFHTSLMQAGFTSTIRYSQGQDIAAACGQLSNQAS